MRTLNIIGEIDGELITIILEKLYKWEEEDNSIAEKNAKFTQDSDKATFEDLTINITSCGGACCGFDAMEGILQNYRGKIITRAYGDCNSCGLLIFLLGEVRIAGRFTDFMYHEISAQSQRKTITQYTDWSEFYSQVQENYKKFIVSRTKLSLEFLNKFETKEYWFGYDEAKLNGIITE